VPVTLVVSGLVLIAGAGGAAVQGARQLDHPRQIVDQATLKPPAPVEPLEPDQVVQPVHIRRGTTFGTLVAGYGLPASRLREAALPYYDLARIRSDRALSLRWLDGDASPQAVLYDIDADRTLILERQPDDSWTARLDEVTYESTPGERAFVIERSLWQDGLDAGLRPADLARLAQIFEYEVDFNTELRAGARLAVAGEILTAPGREPRFGDLHAVRMQNGDSTWTAVRHVLPDDTENWYQEDGKSLRKPFLRSPLEFSRVTSGFNPRRFHPILKRRRPHNGTDFGAPTGTPVRVVAEGKVVRAGWAGGHGRFVKVEHEGGYATSYSHLSAISVKRGQRVGQGQLVGRVGSTGLATGPHLHYQMWKNGRYVDPMKTDLPNQAPLPAGERSAFDAAWDQHVPRLDRAWSSLDAAGPDGGAGGDASGETLTP